MKGLVLIGVLTIMILLIVVIVLLSKKYYQRIYEETKHKASDADIFKLMAKANHFITKEQLATATALTEKEAGIRLNYLAMEGALRHLYDGSGMGSGIYQLKEGIPLFDSLPAQQQGLSDQEIIDVILLHVDDYQVTIAELVVIFGINIYEAKSLMNRLKKADKLTMLYNQGFQKIYVINKPIGSTKPILREQPRKKDRIKIELLEQEKIKIPDAEVLQLAIDHDGRLTPTLLCIKLKISMDEAKRKLENLHEQGVFKMAIDEKNALLEYQIRDRSLLG